MATRKNATARTSTEAGVLRPDRLAQHVDLRRLTPAEPLSSWIENYWILQWDLPSGLSYRSSTLPHPACTLSVERGHVRDGVAAVGPVVVTGVLTRRFDVTVQGAGWVCGVKFRPGGYASFTGAVARTLRDVPVAAPTAFSSDTVSRLARLGPHLDHDDVRIAVDSILDHGERAPEPDYTAVLDIISTMLSDRSIVRVGQIEERCDVGSRRLQRLFERYVGAPPKWVLTRYRIHDVVGELDAGYTGSLADLAARHGWFDQAHFTREFTDLVGVSPGEYQR